MSLAQLPATIHRLVPLRAEIDLGALRHNARVLRTLAGEADLMAVVKADAYGHGAVPVAHTLAAEGIGRFAVATVPEGIELREAGLEGSVLVLAAPLPEYLPAYARYGLEATVATPEGVEAAIEAAAKAGPLTVHVKVDTGMNRLGLSPEDAPEALARLEAAQGVDIVGLWTHLATVDRVHAPRQLARFDHLLAGLDRVPPLVHVSNTGNLLRTPAAREGRTLVRAGGALFGLVADSIAEDDADVLLPVMRLVTRVVHVHTVEAGEAVSYGRRWTAERPTRVATVVAGYGDGYPRALSNRGEVGISGRHYPIAGRVCMDMTMLDLGDPEGPGGAVRVGDEAVLFGTDGPSVLDVARQAGTIAYALTSGLTARVPRVYEGAVGSAPPPEP